MAITDFFDRGWDSNPTGTAFVVGDTRLTYAEFGELSCRIGHALLAADLPGGTKVAVLAGNDPAAWACVLGIWRAGLVFLPLNPHTPAEETQQLLRAFDCEVLLYQAALAPVVGRCDQPCPTSTCWSVSIPKARRPQPGACRCRAGSSGIPQPVLTSPPAVMTS